MCFWQFFKYQSIGEVGTVFGIITGQIQFDAISYNWRYYFDTQLITFVIIGIIGATVLGSPRVKCLYDKMSAVKAGYVVQELVLIALFVLSILFMVNSTYMPFIYFQY